MIPTYSITKDFDWSESENLKLLFDMTAKYGTPYFSNYVNSDMNPSDIRSMAIMPSQEVIYKDEYGRVSKNEIRHLVNIWLNSDEDKKPKYKMLMNGEFVNVTEMFKIPYSDYDTYVSIKLSNGYKQKFSYDHKCAIIRDGVYMEERSQNLKAGDKFLLARHAYNETNKSVGDYMRGRIIGYYLGEGYYEHNGANIAFAINIERDDIVEDIKTYFDKFGCRVEAKRNDLTHIYKVSVYGRQASEFVKNFISGETALEKRITTKMWDTNAEFRRGVYDGYLTTDGSEKNNSFAHTTNKELCQDLITLASTIGKYLKYSVNKFNTRYFKEDKSDLEHFTSYKLDIIEPTVYNDDFYVVDIIKVEEKASRAEFVYNFTVDTKEHLYTLPNGIITHQCCRLRLDLTELRRKNGGFFGSGESTGSVGVVTINLPKLAYESENVEEFYQKLDHIMDVAARSLDIKRKVVTKLMDSGFFPYTKRYLGHFDNHFSTLGLVGMNEAGLNAKWIQAGMDDKRTQDWAEEILNHMRNRLVKYQQEYGALFNLESTPAESTSYRFAKHDKKRYPDIKTANDNGTPYYTNSTNLPVGYTADVFEALDIQDRLQVLYTSGTVFHTFLGEKLPDWKAAAKLVKTISDNYKLPYYTLSPTYSICKNHGYISGEHEVCPECGETCEVYSRITGYYRPIKNWNDGKAQEFEDRKEYVIKERTSIEKFVDSINQVAEQVEKKMTEIKDTITESFCASCGIPQDDIQEDNVNCDNDVRGMVLFTTPVCPNCKIVKAFLESHKEIEVEILDATEGEGKQLSYKLNILQAPTLVDWREDDTKIISGAPAIIAYLRSL